MRKDSEVGAVTQGVFDEIGGDAVASSIEQVHDAEYWRANYTNRPYVEAGDSYDDFAPAFEFGSSRRALHADRSFDELEPELATHWESSRGASRLDWHRARHAARDAWGPAS